jgi:hypothetical protein
VTIPEPEAGTEPESDDLELPGEAPSDHIEIQYLLLKLGAAWGSTCGLLVMTGTANTGASGSVSFLG